MGFSKIRSHPHAECSSPLRTPCSDAVPAPPARPLLLSKPISLLLSMWFAEARHSWLAHTLAALLPHPWSPQTCRWGTSFREQYSIRLVTSDQQQGPGTSPKPFPESLDGQGSYKDLGGKTVEYQQMWVSETLNEGSSDWSMVAQDLISGPSAMLGPPP